MKPSRVDFLIDLGYGLLLFIAIVLIVSVGTSIGVAFGLGALISYIIHVGWKMARFDPDWMTQEMTENIGEKVTEEVTESVGEKVTEEVTESVGEKVTEEVTESVEEKVTEEVTESVEKKVAQEVTENVEATLSGEIDAIIEKLEEVNERIDRRPRADEIEERMGEMSEGRDTDRQSRSAGENE